MPKSELPPSPLPQMIAPLTQLSGSVLGLLAFGVMTLRGLAVGNPIEVVLGRAIAGLLCGATLGFVAGWIAGQIMEERSAALLAELDNADADAADSSRAEPLSVETPV